MTILLPDSLPLTTYLFESAKSLLYLGDFADRIVRVRTALRTKCRFQIGLGEQRDVGLHTLVVLVRQVTILVKSFVVFMVLGRSSLGLCRGLLCVGRTGTRSV
jgi:hypothetical protein